MISEQFILFGSVLLFVCIVISKTSHRLGVPSLLFFLLIGILAGSEGIGGIYFNNPNIAQFIGIIALVIIPYSWGLDTKMGWSEPHNLEGICTFHCGCFFNINNSWTVHQLVYAPSIAGIFVDWFNYFIHRCSSSILHIQI